jgi:PAS domain S-box-containing protein
MTPPRDFAFDTDVLLSVVDQLNAGVYITDLNRVIVLWNRKAEEITGYSAADVVGKACHDTVLMHADKDGHELCHSGHCPLYRSMEVGKESHVPVTVYARTATERRVGVSVSVAPLRNRSGEVVGGIEIFQDETQYLHDLEFAQKIQHSQLPASLPAEPSLTFEVCYYPLELVGGDFYDVRQVAPRQYGLFLADVSGHGVSAALYTMQLKSIADGCWGMGADPSAFLAELNAELAKFVTAESFATALYAVVDGRSGWVSYASAGHPPALHLSADADAVAELHHRGIPLGMMPDTQYEAHEAHLGEGDMLLAYTDGAVEVPGETGQLLGTGGLGSLALEERTHGDVPLLERLYERVKEACSEVVLPDDLTLFSVAYRK